MICSKSNYGKADPHHQYTQFWSHYGIISMLRSAKRTKCTEAKIAELRAEAQEAERRYISYCKKTGAHRIERHACALWLLGKRCRQAYPGGCKDCLYLAPWHAWDHGSLWVRNGKPYSLVSQPYVEDAVDEAAMRELNAWCAERDIVANTIPEAAWYHTRGVGMIELRPAEMARDREWRRDRQKSAGGQK